MEILILGLLMMGNWTIYEMRKYIETNFSSISSNSTGSIQATLKKLLGKELIEYTEYVENSVNKKKYGITDAGKQLFVSRLNEPIKYKEKNMELVKFFFLGFVDTTMQIKQIDHYIGELEAELTALKHIAISKSEVEFDNDYLAYLIQRGATPEVTSPKPEISTLDNLNKIASFQFATLDFAIAKLKFEIKWFSDLKDKLLRV